MFILKRKNPLGEKWNLVYLTGMTKRNHPKYTTNKKEALIFGLGEALKKVIHLATKGQIWKIERLKKILNKT